MNDLLDRVPRQLDDLPDAEQARIARVLAAALRRAKAAPVGRGWAAVGAPLAALDLLVDQSEPFTRTVRAWRDTAGFTDEPHSRTA